MDTTVRNLDPDAYRRLKAHAALTGRTIGDVLNSAMSHYLEQAQKEPDEKEQAEKEQRGLNRATSSTNEAGATSMLTERQRLRESRVRRAWQASKTDPEIRLEAKRWLDNHPSHDRRIDELWVDALEGRGPLRRWLDGSRDALEDVAVPARALLASHPFVVYLRCLARETSAA